MRARELAVRIFDLSHLALAVDLTDRCAVRSARKDTATSLAANHMSSLFAFLKRTLVHHGATGRHNAPVVHDARHLSQDGSASIAGRSRGDGLGRLRHAKRVV